MVTHDDCVEYCKDHLPYELLMFYFTHDSLQHPVHILAANAFIESFCVHARNLLDFFHNTKYTDQSQTRLTATHFVAPESEFAKKRPFGQDIGTLYGKLHAQILHMGERSTPIEGKVSPEERQKLFSFIEKDWTSFYSEMIPSLRALIPLIQKSFPPPSQNTAPNLPMANATGHFTLTPNSVVSLYQN
jgi:hypothetical protein